MPDPELLLRKVSIAGFTLTHERGMIEGASINFCAIVGSAKMAPEFGGEIRRILAVAIRGMAVRRRRQMACGDREQVSVSEWGICWKWGFIPYPCKKTSIKTRYHYMFNPYRTRFAFFQKKYQGCCGFYFIRMVRGICYIWNREWAVGLSNSRQVS